MPITLNGTSRVKGSSEIVRLVGDRLNLVPRLRVYDTDAMKYRVPYPKTKASLPTGKSEESFATPISNGNDLSISSKELTLSEHAVGIEQTDYFNILSCADEKEIDDILEYRFYEKIEKDIIDALIDAESYEETVQASGEYLTFSDLRQYLLAVKKNGYENYVFYATRGQIEALEQENNVEAEVFFETGRINMVPVYELPVDSEIIFLIVNINNIPLVTNGKPSIEKVPTMKAGTQKKATWFYDWDIIDSVYNTAFVPKESIYSNPVVEGDWENFQATGAFVNADGLTFKVDISGVTTTVTDDVVLIQPANGKWSTSEGTQTAKWSYTQDGEDIAYFTKTANVQLPLKNPVIEGDWTNIQKCDENVDATGLTFKATILGVVTDVTDDVVLTSPSSGKWANYEGTQTATWTYTTGGNTLTYTKNANVRDMTIRLGSLIKIDDFEQSTSYAVKFNPKVVVDDLIDDSLFIDHTVYTSASFDHWLGAVDNGEDKAVISYSSGSEILRVYPLLADEFDIDPNKYYVAVGADLEPSFASALPAEVIEYPSEEYTGRLWEGGETYEADDLIELASDYFVLPVTDDVED